MLGRCMETDCIASDNSVLGCSMETFCRVSTLTKLRLTQTLSLKPLDTFIIVETFGHIWYILILLPSRHMNLYSSAILAQSGPWGHYRLYRVMRKDVPLRCACIRLSISSFGAV